MFSKRTGWSLGANRLAAAVEQRRRAGGEILDLTVSNPAKAGIEYPEEEIARALAAGRAHVYEPDPRGERAARDAIARWYEGRGLSVDPERILLTASTSEGYAWLFKLLCDPGDRVLVPRPSYPLFEFLATLESVRVESYPLRYEGRWGVDLRALEARIGRPGPADLAMSELSTADPADGRAFGDEELEAPIASTGESSWSSDVSRTSPARALVLVDPNNPTGSYLGREEADEIVSLAACADLPIVCDEVFATYPLERTFDSSDSGSLDSMLRRGESLPLFVLDGLSKSAGLPGVKAGWIVVEGPASFRRTALERLEVIADTYLSVSAPVQRALPRLLEIGPTIAGSIRARTRANLAHLRSALPRGSAVELLRAEGGWSAVLRLPRTRSEEEWCLALLEEDGVLVQPGWFFDFESEAYLVVSLLTPEEVLREGIARLLVRAR